jgi:hypothetical protein
MALRVSGLLRLWLLGTLAVLPDPFAAITATIVRQTSGRRDSCLVNPWGFRADIDESIRDVYNPVSFVGLRSRHLLAMNGNGGGL